jgi:hypothetical protein
MSVFDEFRKMRLPKLGSTRRLGDEATIRVCFDNPLAFGGGKFYILESDGVDTAHGVYVDEFGKIDWRYFHLQEFEEPDFLELDGNIVSLNKDYKPEKMKHTRSKLRGIVRLIHSFAASCGEFDPPWIKRFAKTLCRRQNRIFEST